MRHQQRLWRHLKDSKRREDAADSNTVGGTTATTVSESSAASGSTKQQKCDMCRNHGEIKSKRAHKNACPYQNCTCALCNLTRKRRDIMRHQQRVRRSQVTSQQHNEAWEYVIQATAELEFLNKSNHTCPTIATTSSSSASSFPSSNHDNHPSSASTSPSPVPSASSGSISFKSEIISTSTPPAPVISNTSKNQASATEMPPLEPLENDSPVRYSPGPVELSSDSGSRPINPLTPNDAVPAAIGVKDLPLMDNEVPWRSLKREREEILRWNPKVQRDDSLFWNLDFMRGHEALTRRLEPSVPMEGVSFHDTVNGMDFVNNHESPFKNLTPVIESSSRLPPTPLKKTRTDENFRYNPMFWGSGSLEHRVGFIPEELQQQCYRRVLMNTSSPDLRMRTPPALIPIPQPQPPLRPRPLAPLRTHGFPTSMEWDHVNLHYLAYFLQNRGGPYCETLPNAGPFGLPRETAFFNSSVP